VSDEKAPTMPILVGVLKITIVYDNNPLDSRMKTALRFLALVEYHGQTLLFGTGGDGRILLENMQMLGIHLARIQLIVLSHAHGVNPTPTLHNDLIQYEDSSRAL
jgi:hypothetical protein